MKKLLHSSKIFKNGFTLAEVLITLVIIGVVAALTIPTVINTYVESSTVAKVKKGISILGQAKKLAEAQNGSIEGWDFGEGSSEETATKFWNYIKPYISVTKDCGASGDCYQSDGFYKLNGSLYSSENINNLPNYYKVILADGSLIWFRTGESGKCATSQGGLQNICVLVGHDVNGAKKPNTVGKDIFVYHINVDGVFPALQNDCRKNSDGWGCATYIVKNSNMNYLH